MLSAPEVTGERNLELNIPTQLRFPNRPDTARSVILKRVSAGCFELFARQTILVGARVQILFRGELANGEVIYCRKEGEGFSVAVNFSTFSTVRRELRYPVQLAAVVRTPESDAPVKARIVDMSPSGLGLHIPIGINVGTRVAVEFERGTIWGEIRHCLPLTGYFRAGLAIEEFNRPEKASTSSSGLAVPGSDDRLAAKSPTLT